jgi:O-antigen ligase
LPLTKKLLGVGLGNELKRFPGTISIMWAGSHNDYLSLTIMTGIIGLLLYLMIYGSVFFLLLSAPLSQEIRLFGIFVFISVIVMNFVSNSYIVCFQMAQLLWFLIGLLYAQGKIESRLHQAESVAKKDNNILYPERI